MSTFSSLGLNPILLEALNDAGYEKPTPIQEQAIPPLLERRDVLGCAQTGTGKTAAFVLPILHRLLEESEQSRGPRVTRALILSPTRELAAQIGESIGTYGRKTNIRHTVIFGGVKPRPQIRALRTGVDIIVATPGRLLDLQRQGYVDLSSVDFFVLDEADRMLDMGFIRDIRTILEFIPNMRQNLLFSATMPPKISELAHTFMRRPVQIEVTPSATTVERIRQAVCFVHAGDKKDALVEAIERNQIERAIVFTRTKHGANKLVRQLVNTNIEADAIHGNKSQNARQRTLREFRDGKLRLLVATDIASRGIDVDGVSHVFIYDLPDEPEAYVHRIGRTGRAGEEGIAITFCSEDQRDLLDDVLRITKEPIPVINREGEEIGLAEVPTGRPSGKRRGGRGGGRGGGGGRRGGGRSQGARRGGGPRSASGRSQGRSGGGSGNAQGSRRSGGGSGASAKSSSDDKPAPATGGSGANKSRRRPRRPEQSAGTYTPRRTTPSTSFRRTDKSNS